MNIRAVINIVSALTFLTGLVLLTAVPVSVMMGDSSEDIFNMFVSAIIPVFVGIVSYAISKKEKVKLGIREGFGIVTFGWLAVSIFGALPYTIIEHLNWYDAFFETISGFTTTGSSVLEAGLRLNDGTFLQSGISDMSYGVLYWRAMTHWLGGMGIVVLSLAILPFLGVGGQQLYNAEVPGPTSDQLTPKIANSAKILWSVYFFLTIIETALLYKGGMSLFDAWCQTCATLATGGFSTQQASVAGFHSPYIEYVITFFMFLAGCNFILHYKALRGKPISFLKDEEFRFYFYIVAIATIISTVSLYGREIITTGGETITSAGISDAFRYSVFQVVSIITTTGFCTADFNLWPVYTTFILIILMFIGGCGGSTGGGMKVSRIILITKYCFSQVKRSLFPHALTNTRLHDQRVDTSVLHKVMAFVTIFLGLFAFYTFLLTLYDIDLVTAFTASIASLGNIGPGLNKVGAASTYSWMPAEVKVILSTAMLLGRLEIFTVLVIFLPSFWKK